MTQTILAIAGRPGLYKLVSRGKSNFIVESLDESHKRIPAFATDRITSLADITMYAESDNVPLMTVLASVRDKEEGKVCSSLSRTEASTVRDKEEGKVCSIAYKKCKPAELKEYFAQILPDFDRDRVHDSDIRKLLSWYDILVKAGITDFEEEMKPTDGDNVDDRLKENEEA